MTAIMALQKAERLVSTVARAFYTDVTVLVVDTLIREKYVQLWVNIARHVCPAYPYEIIVTESTPTTAVEPKNVSLLAMQSRPETNWV